MIVQGLALCVLGSSQLTPPPLPAMFSSKRLLPESKNWLSALNDTPPPSVPPSFCTMRLPSDTYEERFARCSVRVYSTATHIIFVYSRGGKSPLPHASNKPTVLCVASTGAQGGDANATMNAAGNPASPMFRHIFGDAASVGSGQTARCPHKHTASLSVGKIFHNSAAALEGNPGTVQTTTGSNCRVICYGALVRNNNFCVC